MNHLLLTIGLAIILAAAAAIAAPFIVDWASQRAFFEAQATRIFGQPVSIEGAIDVRFLPEPAFRFTDLTIGEPDANGEGVIALGALNVRLAPGAILKAQVEFTAAEIERPSFAVRIEDDGTLVLPAVLRTKVFDPTRVSADAVQVRDGRVSFVDVGQAREWTIANVSGDAAVRALDGPYRFDGGFVLNDVRYGVRLATGRLTDDGMPVNAIFESTAKPLTVSFDGIAGFDGDMPVFDGNIDIAHGLYGEEGVEIGPIWRMDGGLSANPERLMLAEGTLSFGPSEREVKFTGQGDFDLKSDTPVRVALDGRQIDLDRFLGGSPENPVRPSAAIDTLRRLAASISDDVGLRRAVDVEARMSAVVLGGDILQEAVIDARIDTEKIVFDRLSAVFPGNATIGLVGEATGFRDETTVTGTLSVDALNIVPAVRWASAGGAAALRDAEQVIAGLAMKADLSWTAAALQLSEIDGKLRESPFGGSFAFRGATDDQPGEMRVGLEARLLDLPAIDPAALSPAALNRGREDQSADSSGWSWLSRYLVDLNIAVDTLFVGDTGAAGVVADLTVSDGNVDIRDLEIAEVLGASVKASGGLSGWPDSPDGAVTLTVDAAKLDKIAPLLATFDWAPAALSEADGAGVSLFEPAKIVADVTAGLTDSGARLTIIGSGRLGETDIAVDSDIETLADVDGGQYLAADIDLRNASSRALLAQLGVEAPDVGLVDARTVPGMASVLLRGVTNDALETVIDASLLGVNMSLVGTSALDEDDKPMVELDAEATFSESTDLLDFLGLPAPASGVAGRLRAQVTGPPRQPVIAGLVGQIGRTGVSGNLAVGGFEERLGLGGELTIEEVSLPWLLGTAFSTGLSGAAGVAGDGRWPRDPIQSSPFSIVDLDIEMKSSRLAMTDKIALANAEYRLLTRQGALSLDPVTGTLFGSPVAASLDLKPETGGIAVTGRVRLEDADLAAFSELATDTPPAEGRMSLNVQAAGQGRSIQAMVASLTGQGRYSLTDAQIRRLSPNAFPLIVRAADAGMALDDAEVGRVFANHLDGGALSVDTADGVFSLAGGVARISNAILEGNRALVRASGSFDLTDYGMNMVLTLTPDDRTAGVEPQTEVLVSLEGPVSAPSRDIDVSALTGFLTVQKFEREVQRIEILQADILERQRLTRELALHRQQLAKIGGDGQQDEEPAPPEPEEAAVPEPEPAPRQSQATPTPPRPANNQSDFSQRIRSALEPNAGGSTVTVEPLPPPIDLSPQSVIGQ